MKTRHTLAIALLLTQVGTAYAADALLAFAGDVDQAEVSQAGYCGERKRVNPDDLARVQVEGDKQVWVFVKAVHRMGKQRSVCTVEREFTPKAGDAYIVRVSYVPKQCNAEVLQAVPSGDPRPVRSVRSERVGC